MTEAIRTGSFTSGFMNGVETVDRHVDRRERRENQREAISMQKEDRAFNQARATASDARADEAIQMQRDNFALKQQQFQTEQKRGARRMEWEASNQKRKQREGELKELAEQSGQYAHLTSRGMLNTVDPDELLAFHKKAEALGRPNQSPLYWNNDTVGRVKKVGHLLQQFQAGQVGQLNAPGNLKLLSDVPGWKDKLNVGVGEMGANGSPIAKKEIAEFQMAPPNGDDERRAVIKLRVHTEDGESYISEMSAFRGTNPNEPIHTADIGSMIDNLIAQTAMADLYGSPEAQAYAQSILQRGEKPVKYTDIQDLAGGGKAGLSSVTGRYEKIETGDLDLVSDKELENLDLTEGEAKAAAFHMRMTAAQVELDSLGNFDPKAGFEALQGRSNITASPEYQRYEQGAQDWIRAKLRKESGAVIGDNEMQKEFETYFPVFGDSEEVLAQKARARKVAEEGMLLGAGMYRSQYLERQQRSEAPQAETKMATQNGAPQAALQHLQNNPQDIGMFEAKYGYRPEDF